MKTKLFAVIAALTLTSLATAQIPNYVPTNGLQGYWPFTGNANDLSGNLYNGTVNGALLTTDRFGNPNSAYSFDGISDYISTNYTGVLGAGSRAVSFWAQSATNTAMPAVAWGENSGTGSRFDCGFNYVNPGATIDGSYSAITYSTNSPTNDSTWHHYVFQFDSTTLNQVEVYQDGVALIQTLNIYNQTSTVNTVSNFDVQFGTIIGLPDYFNGQLDDIGIWNRKLTSCEIQHLFTSSLSTVTLSATHTVVCQGGSSLLGASGANTYTWNSAAQTSTLLVYPTTTSVYTVSGTNSRGCIGSTTISVSVDICTGIPLLAAPANEILAYPNPTSGFVTISGVQEQVVVEVYNMLGSCVYKTISKSDQILIDLNNQPNGVYFIKTGGRGQKVTKIIKE